MDEHHRQLDVSVGTSTTRLLRPYQALFVFNANTSIASRAPRS